MKIVNLLFSFNTGGVENLLVDVINKWDVCDDQLLVIINNKKNDALVSKIRCSSRVKVICLNRTPGGSVVNYLIQLERLLKKYKPDVIHCHSTNAVKFILPLKLIHPEYKLFLTLHNTGIYPSISATDKLLHKLFLKKIIAISNSVREEIILGGIYSSKVELIYNGIDNHKFESNDKHLPQDGIKRIICIARLSPSHKGQDVLVRALAILRERRQDFECLLIGSAPVEHPENEVLIRDLIASLHLEAFVKMMGDRNDVPRWLCGADVLVLPSRYEGFGIVIVEAMMAGVPVIASDVGGPKEILDHNRYGYLVEVENARQIAETIDHVLSTDQSAVVQCARSYAVDNFSVDIMVDKLRKLYMQ